MAASKTIVLITGANSGLGFASAEVIASASSDYHVIIASRMEENGRKAMEELSALKNVRGSFSTVQLEVTDPESIKKAAKEVENKFGRVDVLINNAGAASRSTDFKTNLVETLTINAVGPALVTTAFMPLLLKSQHPRSIYVSSALGCAAVALDPQDAFYDTELEPYRMSKAALNMWMLQESKKYGRKGVKTFAFCPGLIRSNMRGKSEEARNAGGAAGDPLVAGRTMLSIIEGKRDADIGRVVHKDGVWPW